MKDIFDAPPQVPLRPASTVMRLSRMGSMFPTRLSFLRSLMRRLASERAEVIRRDWQMCAEGFGHAVFSVDLAATPIRSSPSPPIFRPRCVPTV